MGSTVSQIDSVPTEYLTDWQLVEKMRKTAKSRLGKLATDHSRNTAQAVQSAENEVEQISASEALERYRACCAIAESEAIDPIVQSVWINALNYSDLEDRSEYAKKALGHIFELRERLAPGAPVLLISHDGINLGFSSGPDDIQAGPSRVEHKWGEDRVVAGKIELAIPASSIKPNEKEGQYPDIDVSAAYEKRFFLYDGPHHDKDLRALTNRTNNQDSILIGEDQVAAYLKEQGRTAELAAMVAMLMANKDSSWLEFEIKKNEQEAIREAMIETSAALLAQTRVPDQVKHTVHRSPQYSPSVPLRENSFAHHPRKVQRAFIEIAGLTRKTLEAQTIELLEGRRDRPGANPEQIIHAIRGLKNVTEYYDALFSRTEESTTDAN